MRLTNIQMLRALAAMMVVVHHVSESLGTAGIRWNIHGWGSFAQIGAAGVDLFFVISGFIMIHVGGQGFEGPIEGCRFLFRRFLRIFPAYWIATAFAVAVWVAGIGFRNKEITLSYLLGSAFCVPMHRHPLIDQGWTLSFELYFYMVFTVGMLVLRTPTRFLMGSFGLFVLGMLGGRLPDQPMMTEFFGNPMLFEFWVGAAIGVLHRNKILPTKPKLGIVWLAEGLLVLSYGAVHGVPWSWRVFYWGGPSALVLLAALQLPHPSKGGWLFLVRLGDASYAIYLIHAFLTLALPRFVATVPTITAWGNALGALLVLGAAACGYCFWRWIETPVQSRLQPLVRSKGTSK